MKNFRIFSVLAAMLISAAAHAAPQQYEYSFKFSDGALLKGSFVGEANGNLITNLTNISAGINGVMIAPSDPTFGLKSSSLSPVNGWHVIGTAVASFDGLENNFFFAADPFEQTGEKSRIVGMGSNWGFIATGSNSLPNFEHADGAAAYSTSWNVTAVPEPETYAMMLAGLGMMGAIARRRKQKTTTA